MAYAQSLPKEYLEKSDGESEVLSNMQPIKKPKNAKLENVQYYGRFDIRPKMKLQKPDVRNGFNVKNKIFFQHHNQKDKMIKS